MNRAPVALVGLAAACLVLVGCANNGKEPGVGDEAQREMTDTGDSGGLVERDGIDSESELVVRQDVDGEEIDRRAWWCSPTTMTQRLPTPSCWAFMAMVKPPRILHGWLSGCVLLNPSALPLYPRDTSDRGI